MHAAAIAAGVSSVAAWVYLLLGRGWFWRVHKCSTRNICGKAQDGNAISVVAVVPARNERETIGRCITSLFGQRFAGKLRVMVVDDQSEDGTADAARAAGHPHLTVISGKAVPEGWTGKVWAMQQGIEAAREFSPDYLLLTDADVVHAPDSLATLVTRAQECGYDLVSFMVRLHCESVAERLLIPAFVFFFFLLYPPEWIADPRKKTAAAAGGCMLVRAEALERAGGMEAIRGEVIDDCALARVIKAQGTRRKAQSSGSKKVSSVWLGLSDDTVSLRAYGGFVGIGRMIARTAFNQLRHSAVVLAGALVGLAIAFVVPIALVFVLVYPTLAKPGLGWATLGSGWATLGSGWGTLGSGWGTLGSGWGTLGSGWGTHGSGWGTLGLGWASDGLVLGGVAWALMTLVYLPMVRWYRLHPLWAVTLPLAASFYMGATLWSAAKYWSGKGGEWKGRAQDKG